MNLQSIWLSFLRFTILDCLAKLAVIANAFLIAFTSTYLDELVYAYKTNDFNLEFYLNFTLSVSKNNAEIGGADCLYRGYRDENGKYEFTVIGRCRQ